MLYFIRGEIMDNMAEARKKMHEVEKKREEEKKSKTKKIRNFFFGCCRNK